MSATQQHSPMTPAQLMQAMGAKWWDPMPTDQHQWQQAEGEPPLMRLWSWMCAHTIAHDFRSPCAVRADGKPATLKDASKELSLDLGQVSRLWSRGEQKGLWCRKGRELHLNGGVTLAQVSEANKRRKLDCTTSLSPSDLLKIKGWPKERREAFYAAWVPLQKFRDDYEALKIAEARAECDPIEDSMRRRFELEKIRHTKEKRKPVAFPQLLLDFVQSTPAGVIVQSNGHDRTEGEAGGENVAVQRRSATPSLLGLEVDKNLGESVGQSEQPGQSDRPTEGTIAKLLHEELEHLHQTPRPKLLADIRAALNGAPLSYLRTRIRGKLQQNAAYFKSVGLTLPLAAEVGEAWQRGEPDRQRQAKRDAEVAEGQAALNRKMAAETLADPSASEAEKQHAREILGEQSKGAAS